MNINGFFASIMRAEKKTEGSNGGLPPGVPIPVLPVDFLKVRPDNWIGGEGSYVCPVDSEWGLWFNFTMNNPGNTSVLPSVKGMNPITGQRVNGYELEDYAECPIHKKPFSKGRLCTECGFKWPEQNFLSKPNPLYIDGFRTPDGNVRQFYFTEDMAKSIPELVIGKEDTVPAFGFCFYKQKKYSPDWETSNHVKNKFPEELSTSNAYYGMMGTPGVYTSSLRCSSSSSSAHLIAPLAKGSSAGGSSAGASIMLNSVSHPIDGSPISASYCCMDSVMDMGMAEVEVKTSGGIIIPDSGVLRGEVGIGAGAKIKQGFSKSSLSCEKWESKPTGIMRIYFVFQEEFDRYASAGFKDLTGNKEGYLEGLKVGGSNE